MFVENLQLQDWQQLHLDLMDFFWTQLYVKSFCLLFLDDNENGGIRTGAELKAGRAMCPDVSPKTPPKGYVRNNKEEIRRQYQPGLSHCSMRTQPTSPITFVSGGGIGRTTGIYDNCRRKSVWPLWTVNRFICAL